jgi:hypothetical protein
MPARFADRPPRLPAPNPSVGRPVILEVDKFADVTISPADLTVTERSVLLVLMAESRPVPNPDLVAFGPKLDKPGRDKLNKLGSSNRNAAEGDSFTSSPIAAGGSATTFWPPARLPDLQRKRQLGGFSRSSRPARSSV